MLQVQKMSKCQIDLISEQHSTFQESSAEFFTFSSERKETESLGATESEI